MDEDPWSNVGVAEALQLAPGRTAFGRETADVRLEGGVSQVNHSVNCIKMAAVSKTPEVGADQTETLHKMLAALKGRV